MTWDNENAIEFLRDQKIATGTFCQGRYVSKIKKLAEERPDECQITDENPDGSIVAHFPVSWVKIAPPREVNLTEEQKTVLAERLRSARRS